MVWTQFMDMHSGGGRKTDFEYIFIEAPEDEAIKIFEDLFGQDPCDTACDCCGQNFSITEEESLEQATGYDRGCAYAYLDKSGNKIPKNEAWIMGKGTTDKVNWQGYIEEVDSESAYKKYVPLNEYLKRKDIKVFRKEVLNGKSND